MARIAIFGGTGYAGGNIAAEAASRGHEVVSYTRGIPAEPATGIRYETGSLLEASDRSRALADADVVVVAAAPRGDMELTMRTGVAALATDAAAAGVRLGVVGGAGSSLEHEDGPRLDAHPDFPDTVKPEAGAMGDILDDLRGSDDELDWFYVHPASVFGPWAPGTRVGSYRTGGNVVVRDADGNSQISGEDFGIAFVDEIDSPQHRRARFTVGY